MFLISFLLNILLYKFGLPYLQSAAQPIRDLGPKSHKLKEQTPTMGGIIFVLSTFILSATLMLDISTTALIATMLFFGIVGFVDDYTKVKLKNHHGISAKLRLLLQFTFSAAVIFMLQNINIIEHSSVIIPGMFEIQFGTALYILFASFVVVGTANAVNLTDGLDGLAVVPSIMVLLSLTLFNILAGPIYSYADASKPIIQFNLIFAGALTAFYWFNCKPAKIFMGDCGSLSIGAVIGLYSVITNQEIALLIMGALFVVEAMSVIIQVTYFKLYKKRIFKMAPVHHHLELSGWKEEEVVSRAYIFTMAAIALYSTL